MTGPMKSTARIACVAALAAALLAPARLAYAEDPALQNLLSGNPKDMLDGKQSPSPGFTVGWICSFSLPIITLCAFIVLNIFLQLFDLIFRWLLFIKICIPIPRRR